MIKNIIDDVAFLTSVSDTTLKKLINVTTYSIGHAVHESLCEQADFAILDIGIGELHIKIEGDCIKYRFVPDKELESMLHKTIINKQSPILTKLDGDLQDRINKVYKELL